MHYDNQSVILLENNQVYDVRTKHINVRFHKIRELISSIKLVLEKIYTSDNAMDMLTKLVTIEKFKHCLDFIDISICKIGDDPTYLPMWNLAMYVVFK